MMHDSRCKKIYIYFHISHAMYYRYDVVCSIMCHTHTNSLSFYYYSVLKICTHTHVYTYTFCLSLSQYGPIFVCRPRTRLIWQRRSTLQMKVASALKTSFSIIGRQPMHNIRLLSRLVTYLFHLDY